jgi:hypothetical protein
MAGSETLIRDRVISVRVMSDVTEVTFKQTMETRVMAFGREGTKEELMEMSGW